MPRQNSDSDEPDKNINTDKENRDNTSSETSSQKRDTTTSPSQNDGLSALREHHKEMISLLDTISKSDSGKKKENIDKLFKSWIIHSCVEEDVLIPELKKRNIDSADIMEAEVKRDLIKILIANIPSDSADKAQNSAKLRVAEKLMRGLIELEEKPGSGLFSRIKSFNIEGIQEKISEEIKDLEKGELPELQVKNLSLSSLSKSSSEKEYMMANQDRYSHDRYIGGERDYDNQYERGNQRRDERYSGRYQDDKRSVGTQGGSYGRQRDDDIYGGAGERQYSGRGGSYRHDRYYSDDRQNQSYGRSSDQDYGRYGQQGDYGRWNDPENRGRGQTRWSGYPEGRTDDYTHDRDYRGFSGRDQDDLRRSSYETAGGYRSGRYSDDDSDNGNYRSGGYGRAHPRDDERREQYRENTDYGRGRDRDRDQGYGGGNVSGSGWRNRGYS